MNLFKGRWEKKEKDYKSQTLSLEQEISALQETQDTQNVSIEKLEHKKAELQQISDGLKEHVYFLSGYESFLSSQQPFFSRLITIQNTIKELYQDGLENDSSRKDLDCLGHIINKFQNNQEQISGNISQWEQVFRDLPHGGVITEQGLLQRLKSETTDESRIKILGELLIREIYKKYVSNLLIMIEEIRNLSYFINGRSDLSIDSLSDDLNFLITQTPQVSGLKINYIPLFANFEETEYKNADFNASQNDPVGPLYRNIKIEKNFILEVKSYGLGEPSKVIFSR